MGRVSRAAWIYIAAVVIAAASVVAPRFSEHPMPRWWVELGVLMLPSPSAFGRILPIATCAQPCAGTQSNATERLREGPNHNVRNMYTRHCNA